MTPTQLDEAAQALQQSTDCHDNSVSDQPKNVTLASHTEEHDDTTFDTQEGDDDMHSNGGDIQDDTYKDNEDTTLQDGIPSGLPDYDNDGNHSDSSNDGLYIDYQSDAETEGWSVCLSVCLSVSEIYMHVKYIYTHNTSIFLCWSRVFLYNFLLIWEILYYLLAMANR